MGNKIKYGLSNVHYAMRMEGEDGAITYGTPKRIPGAVNLALSPTGDAVEFAADDNPGYFSSPTNSGYEGTLEMALAPDTFRVDALGEEVDAKNVQFENAGALAKAFALLFEFKGDQRQTRHVLYNCKATRPNLEGSTKSKSIEPKTDTLNVTVSPNPDGMVKAKTTDETDAAVFDNWYAEVQQKAQADAPTA